MQTRNDSVSDYMTVVKRADRNIVRLLFWRLSKSEKCL